MALPAAIALSGLNEDYFSDGLNDVFNRGAVLLKSPSLSSVASSEDAYSQESGISSMSSETSVIRNLGPFFDMLFSSQQIELKGVRDESPQPPDISPIEEPLVPSQILHEKRNILDLGTNIGWKWEFKVAELKSGPAYFFENRSQYSRVLGAHIPEHVIITCSIEGCSFREPRYE